MWIDKQKWTQRVTIFRVHINAYQKASVLKETLNILDKMNWLVDVNQTVGSHSSAGQ